MRVSIITVCYNSEKTIEDTIQSVLSQSYPKIEYIIIDGGSTDNTISIVNKYKDKIALVVSEKDKGIYDAINKGINKANGHVIALLHADDFYADEYCVEKMMEVFDATDSQGVYADLQYVSPIDKNKITRTWISGEYKIGKFLWGWMPPHPAFFVKRDVYLKYGKYSLELKSAADYEFMLRVIHKHKIKIGYLNKVIVKMREGGMSNVSVKNRIRANQEDRKAWVMNDLEPYFFTLFLKPLSKLKQFFLK